MPAKGLRKFTGDPANNPTFTKMAFHLVTNTFRKRECRVGGQWRERAKV
ncbi:MAG: hypothetical protein JST45_11465 [Bacteroidetes bacterium]|nr:hypothetical protein [Bacteroidota bacterium]